MVNLTLDLALQLNFPPQSNHYKDFPGPNKEQMPLLIAEGRIPLSFAGLMKRRLEVLDLFLSASRGITYEQFSDLAENPRIVPFYELLLAWWDNYLDTGMGALRHSNGSMKVAPAAQYIRSLTPETKLVSGAVPLTDKAYSGLAGFEFSKADVGKHCGMSLSITEVKENLVWLALAENDKALLSAFADATFAQAKERFGYTGKMMGVYAPPVPVPDKGADGYLWIIASLVHSSGAIGYSRVDLYGHLVAAAPYEQRAAAVQLGRSLLEQLLN